MTETGYMVEDRPYLGEWCKYLARMLKDALYTDQAVQKDDKWDFKKRPISRPFQEFKKRWDQVTSGVPSHRPVPASLDVEDDWEHEPPSYADMIQFDEVRILMDMLPNPLSLYEVRRLHEILEMGSIRQGSVWNPPSVLVGERYQSSVSVHNAGAMEISEYPYDSHVRLAELKRQRDAARARAAAAEKAKRAREDDAEEADDDGDDDIKGLDDIPDLEPIDEEELRPVDSEEVRKARKAMGSALKRAQEVERYQKWRRDNKGDKKHDDFYGSGSGSESGTSGKASGAMNHKAFMEYLNSPLALTAAK